MDQDFENRPLKKAKNCESSVLDDPLTSPSISASSLISYLQINSDPLGSPPSTTNSTSSALSVIMNEEKASADDDNQTVPPSATNSTPSTVSEFMNEEKASEDDDNQTVSANDNNQLDEHEEITDDLTYDYLPQDYALSDLDECAHLIINDSSEKEILVKIDQVFVEQCELVCLQDSTKWLNDAVISAYICCIKEVHVQNKNNPIVYFENPCFTGLLKRDGEIGIHGATFLTDIVVKYLQHDMINLPINIERSRWYLACVNVKKSEIQVLDSLCWEHNRIDLTKMLQGLQYHLDILKTQKNLCNHNWKDLDVTNWAITEKLHNPIQEDSGYIINVGFHVKYDFFCSNHAIHLVKIITDFRYKLAAILICWKTNTAQASAMIESDYSEEDPNDVMIVHELQGGLCSYIKSIKCAETLDSKPYPISLTLKKLQGMLNEELPMDCDCFNLVVRKIITDFGRHPKFRKKLDVEKLAYSVRSWPGIKYNVSSCKMIHIPIKSSREFILFILDKDTRTVYILDPTPIDPIYQRNPHAKYVYRLIWIAEHLPKAMSVTCPGSIHENILLWHQEIINNIPIQNRELSGYLVTHFMSTWDDEKVNLPFLKDGYELRKQILGKLLTFKENECEDNMPIGVLDFINCIRKIKPNINVKN
ncbi:hypothetical protein BRADI_2g24252v3 [Brachypodium distachyon]|uniref:Ubiquitin-like protease family profile domain-containing protein n=1 Tax=Brachypodium distachyon TaxID=15368 RepID=A0A2K2DA85_BRADI|nr:hypothetical protein BRADI_2g24252v3 [Brachypodium distachyon]